MTHDITDFEPLHAADDICVMIQLPGKQQEVPKQRLRCD